MDEPSPANAHQFAEMAVTITRDTYGIELDFSPSSLEQVDSLILGFRSEGHTADTMYDSIFIYGCYVGEVLIRNHGGQWKLANDALVVETPAKVVCNPIGKAFKLLANGMEDSVAFFYALAMKLPMR